MVQSDASADYSSEKFNSADEWSQYKFGTWYPIESAPEGVPVNTRISDSGGVRNEQVMTRSGKLWWIKDMYVYYQPTEWSPPSPASEER